MQRRLLIGSLALVAIAGGSYVAITLSFGSRGVPQEFEDARLNGALAAQNIVNLSGQSTSNLEKVNQLVNEDHNYVDALNLVTQVITESQGIRDQATTLSSDLEKMTQALSSIQSVDAQQAALESISNRLALLSHLVNYSNYLGQLLDAVRGEISGTPPQPGQIQTLVNDLNAEVNAINNFNGQANQAMGRFDSIVAQ